MSHLVTKLSLVAVCLLSLCASKNLLALDTDRDQPIRIQADSAMVDENEGTSVYRGNVIIEQGTLRVRAEEVEIFTSESDVIQIIARSKPGSLAHYEQQTNLDRDMVTAQARKITYLVQEERLHLSGRASLSQAGDKFTGELLYYDLTRKIVNLSSGGGSDRINMTITPKKRSE